MERSCTRCGVVKPITDFARKGKYRAAACKPCLREWAAEYRHIQGDLVNANARQGYAENPLKKKLSKKAYRERHLDKIRQKSREKYLRGYAENPQRWLAANTRRKRNLGIGMDAFDKQVTLGYRTAIQQDPCLYCDARGEHVDHYFPVAKGGTDHWWNLVRACGPCNRRKHARCGTWFRLSHALADKAAA